MNRYYGFDLGDAESAVSKLEKEKQSDPEMLSVEENKSFITAYAETRDGQLIIGEKACYEPEVVVRKERFKSKYLVDPDVKKDLSAFASGVLSQLYRNGDLIRGDDTCFYVGCPAGWDAIDREDYRLIFEKCGYPPVRIISESRAALVSACQSKHLQVGYDILNKPVLVIDIGSSTTDFAYINGGKEVELKTGGEVFLGGGIMDEIILEESISSSNSEKKIRKILSESEPWHSYCDFSARRLKEKYFSDEAFWKGRDCMQSISLHSGLMPVKLTLCMNEKIVDKLYHQKVERLGNRSFYQVFVESLQQIKKDMITPELVFLTGGVSAMPVIRQWCREEFPDAVVIAGSEPAFSVAKGLSYCGRIDEELKEFKEEIDQLIDSHIVERIVEKHINELYRSCVEAMVEPILMEVALPIVEQYRQGNIERLRDIDELMKQEIDAYLHTDEARKKISRPVSKWLKQISYELEEDTMPICVRHNVPYSALSLTTYLSITDMSIDVQAKDLFAVKEITWLIDGTVSIIVGLLCGGGGAAIIANGLPGIIAGSVISLLILALGKDKMQEALFNAKIPKPVRLLIPKSYLKARMDVISESVKSQMLKMLEEEKNDEITEQLVDELSLQIKQCLVKMAKVVEIPLG